MTLNGILAIWYENIAWIAFFAALLSVIVMGYRAQMRIYTQRIAHLKSAQAAVSAHEGAIKAIINDEKISPELKEFMLTFSGMVTDRKFAYFLMDIMKTGALFDRRHKRSKSQFAAEFKRLKTESPNSLENIDIAVENGMYALFLKWPETAKAFVGIATMMSATRDRDIQVVERATDYQKQKVAANSINCDGGFAVA